jgi:hypothetical protein
VPNCAEPKPFSWAKPAYVGFFFIEFHSAGSHTEHCWRCSKSVKQVWNSFSVEEGTSYTLFVE